MKDLVVNRKTLPDWHGVKSLVMVYPYKLQDREHLLPFYNIFLTYIPDEIKIILLVNHIDAEREIERLRIEYGITNDIEFLIYPNLFDIWIRDYAPLIIEEGGSVFPVKFNYNPSYVEKKYADYIEQDNQIGGDIGKRLVSEGIMSVYFNWDIGNLTHNGAGTAIITKQFIKDNKTRGLDELKSMLHVFCGFDNIIFIPTEPGDRTGHVDGMCRFIDEKVIVVGSYSTASSNCNFMDMLAQNLQEDLGPDYTIIRLLNGEPEDHKTEGIASALGNHMNFLRLGDRILFPYYSDEISEAPMKEFIEKIEHLDLNIEIVPVDLPEIWVLGRLGGLLNCVSWQVFR
jgi:agmatine deiminase